MAAVGPDLFRRVFGPDELVVGDPLAVLRHELHLGHVGHVGHGGPEIRAQGRPRVLGADDGRRAVVDEEPHQ